MEREKPFVLEQLPMIRKAKDKALNRFKWAVPMAATSSFLIYENEWELGTVTGIGALGFAVQSFRKYCEFRRRRRARNREFLTNASQRHTYHDVRRVPRELPQLHPVPIEGTQAS